MTAITVKTFIIESESAVFHRVETPNKIIYYGFAITEGDDPWSTQDFMNIGMELLRYHFRVETNPEFEGEPPYMPAEFKDLSRAIVTLDAIENTKAKTVLSFRLPKTKENKNV
jgi:hypothetical protein